jgi:hypothetical protein
MVDRLFKRITWTLWGSMESNINHITKFGFKTKTIRVDGEGAINTECFESRIVSPLPYGHSTFTVRYGCFRTALTFA